MDNSNQEGKAPQPDSSQLGGLLKFQIDRKIKNLYKQFFYILEEIYRSKGTSAGHNILTEEKYKTFRKKILDDGNSCYRELEELIDRLEIALKK